MAHSFFSAHPQLEQVAGNRMNSSRKLIRLDRPSARRATSTPGGPALSSPRAAGTASSTPSCRSSASAAVRSPATTTGSYRRADQDGVPQRAHPRRRARPARPGRLDLPPAGPGGYPGSYQQLVAPSWRSPTFTLAAYKFDRVLEMYQGIFGADRVLLARHEQMRSDIGDFLARLEAFVGADAGFRGSHGATINPSLSNKEARVLRRLNHLRNSECPPALPGPCEARRLVRWPRGWPRSFPSRTTR